MHDCKQEPTINKLFDGLDTIKAEMSSIKQDTALTNQLLTGVQGMSGLVGRLIKLETDVKNLNVVKAQFGAIGAVAGGLVAFAVSIFK